MRRCGPAISSSPKNGLLAYAGKRGQTAAYTPVDPSSIMAELNSVTAPPQVSRRTTQSARGEPGVIVESQNAPPQYLPPLVDLRGQVAK